MLIWYEHYVFFIRYGLKDAFIVFLNTILLFLILFYVYPLKFLFKTLFTLFSGLISGDMDKLEKLFTDIILIKDTSALMIIYGLGAASIFVTIALLYLYAVRKRDLLQLNEVELFDTKSSIYINLISAAIPLISVMVATFGIGGQNTFTLAGMTYWLYPVFIPLYMTMYKRKRVKLIENL